MSVRKPQSKRNQKRLSGYQFFLRQVLDELKVRQQNSSIVLSDVSKMCAETWQNLHELVKKRFQDEADAINEANFKLTGGGGNKSKAQCGGPKRPLSAFILYCKEYRRKIKKTNPEMSMGQVSTVLSVKWSIADDETKSKYKKISLEQRERYQKELSASAQAKARASTTDTDVSVNKQRKKKLE